MKILKKILFSTLLLPSIVLAQNQDVNVVRDKTRFLDRIIVERRTTSPTPSTLGRGAIFFDDVNKIWKGDTGSSIVTLLDSAQSSHLILSSIHSDTNTAIAPSLGSILGYNSTQQWQSFTFSGTLNEIDISVTTADIKLGLSDNLIVTASLTVPKIYGNASYLLLAPTSTTIAGAKVGIGTLTPPLLFTINSEFNPINSQFNITAGGLSSLSFINYSPDDIEIAFGADYINNGWISRTNTGVAWIFKDAGSLGFYGSVVGIGDIPGENRMLTIDLSTGNVGIGADFDVGSRPDSLLHVDYSGTVLESQVLVTGSKAGYFSITSNDNDLTAVTIGFGTEYVAGDWKARTDDIASIVKRTDTLAFQGTSGNVVDATVIPIDRAAINLLNGYFGIGAAGGFGAAISPTSLLDVSFQGRSGTHPIDKFLYVTGAMTSGISGDGGIEFRHSAGTAGIGFGYNTIYETGSDTDVILNLLSKGTQPITLNAYSYSTGGVLIGTTVVTNVGAGDLVLPNATGELRHVNAAANNTYSSVTMNASDDIIFGNVSGTSRLRTSCETPGTLVNGDIWVGCTGSTPNRVISLNIYDGGATRVLSAIVY